MAINKNVLAEKQATVLSEDGNTMYATIQMRHGKESEMDKSKFVPAEMGVATDTKKAFMAFGSNQVKEMMFREDSEIEELLDEVREISDQAVEAVESAEATAKQTIEDYTEQMKATIPEDYTEMVKKVDILERTKAPAIHQTAAGNPITLTDAGEGIPVVDFALDGKTEQVQTTGAQLIEYPYFSDSQTINGVTFSVLNQGEIRVQGEATQTVNFPLYSLNYKNGKSYYISGCPKGGSSGTYNIRTGNGRVIDTGDGITYSPNEDGSTNININIQTGTKVNGLIFKPMLNSGSEALPWEPYTGGQPSPSPDYPQEIINAGKFNEETQKWEYEISVGGANILNISSAELSSSEKPSGLTDNGFTVVNTETNSSGRAVYVYVPKKLEKGKQYIIHIQADAKVATYLPEINQYGIRYNQPFSPEETVNKIGVYVDKDVYGEFEVRNIMLNEGTEPLPYEPYRTPQTLTLQSDRPLTKWDRLEKRDGQWGWVYKSSITTIELERMINLSNENKGGVFTVPNKLLLSNTENFAENAIKNNTYEDGTYCENKVNFIFCGTSSDTLETLKQKYDGADFVYQTAEETFVPLTDSEQSALEALTTYFPTTIISNDADCEMEIEYVADTKTYIDNKFAELAQNLAATQNTLLEV